MSRWAVGLGLLTMLLLLGVNVARPQPPGDLGPSATKARAERVIHVVKGGSAKELAGDSRVVDAYLGA